MPKIETGTVFLDVPVSEKLKELKMLRVDAYLEGKPEQIDFYTKEIKDLEAQYGIDTNSDRND